MNESNELLTCKELAVKLKRDTRYVYQMRARGFKMPGNRTTEKDALEFLKQNGCPYSTKYSKLLNVHKST